MLPLYIRFSEFINGRTEHMGYPLSCGYLNLDVTLHDGDSDGQTLPGDAKQFSCQEIN